jgi:hypothetical protein
MILNYLTQKNLNKMKRFKTKQEFEKEFGEDWRKILISWESSMDFLFGFPYDNILTVFSSWEIDEDIMITTKPHPYEGHDFIIKIEDKEQWNQAQKKLFALGYLWWNGVQSQKFPSMLKPDILIEKGKIMYNPDSEEYYILPVLTFDHFMEGYWPYITTKNEKKDAYVSDTGHFIVWDGKDEFVSFGVHIQDAYKFNLMSEKEYRKKHPFNPPPEPLKFGVYNVEPKDDYVTVGCESFSKTQIHHFYEMSKIIRKYNIPLNGAFDFIRENYERLELKKWSNDENKRGD